MTHRANSPEGEILHASGLLRSGKLVAFPTETVYGLGANALDGEAVQRIFDAKGRPQSSPIIVHVSSMKMVKLVAAEWPEQAEVLARAFWPGPLTLVLKKRPSVPDLVTAGLGTVGIRMPSHPVAVKLIEAVGVPIAAPSANRFTQLSPTTAEHVRRSLGDRVDYVLDGGPCAVGIESTVLSLAGGKAVHLRPGGVSRPQIEALIGPITLSTETPLQAHPSPGMHAQHYSPQTRLLLVHKGEVPDEGKGAYLQLRCRPAHPVQEPVQMPGHAEAYAAKLYQVLHYLDESKLDWIAVDTPEDVAEWEAVLDRLRRASWEEEPAYS